jgi:hypothetical protein
VTTSVMSRITAMVTSAVISSATLPVRFFFPLDH